MNRRMVKVAITSDASRLEAAIDEGQKLLLRERRWARQPVDRNPFPRVRLFRWWPAWGQP